MVHRIHLGDAAEIASGSNTMRLSEDEQERRYSNADFEHDFPQMKLADIGNAVIYRQAATMSHTSAAVISNANREKIISQVFCVIKPDIEKIHPWYLCYVLDHSQMVARQMNLFLQGSVIVKISANQLKSLRIPYPPIEMQKKIGRIYALALYQQYLEKKKADQKMLGILAILDDKDRQ